MASIKEFREIAKDKKLSFAAMGEVALANKMAGAMGEIGKILATEDGQRLVELITEYEVQKEVLNGMAVAGKHTIKSDDGSIRSVYTAGGKTTLRCTPEELAVILVMCPEAIKVVKDTLIEKCPRLFAELNDEQHLVSTQDPYGSTTDKSGAAKMLEIVTKYRELIDEIMATYAGKPRILP